MRILCFIDGLGSGGAQRQLVNLAIGFREKGNDVSFLVYDSERFYSPLLNQCNIPVIQVFARNYFERIIKCVKIIRSGKYDAVLSFLETPSFIAEISALPCRRFKLIVGERSASPKILHSFRGRVFRYFHSIADFVVSNSNQNRLLVKKANPFLIQDRNITIYNTYDLNLLNPLKYIRNSDEDGKFHLLVVASHQYVKNLKNLAVAVSLLNDTDRNRLVIDWYGSQVRPCYDENVKVVKSLNLGNIIRFFPPTLDVYQKMIDADAVGLFSFYEGLSNTICEAMCLARPVITTDVSDNRFFIDEPKLISDPNNPRSISNSLSYLMSLNNKELNKLGKRNRDKAERLFDKQIIINRYLSIMK